MDYKYVLFGNLKTVQVKCPKCETWQFQSNECDCGYDLRREPFGEKRAAEIRIEEPGWRASISTLKREKIYERDDYICQYCGTWCFESYLRNPKSVTIDHMTPISAGGTNKVENLVTCCSLCNITKGSKIFNSFDEAREYITNARKNDKIY